VVLWSVVERFVGEGANLVSKGLFTGSVQKEQGLLFFRQGTELSHEHIWVQLKVREQVMVVLGLVNIELRG
jgi:hypothetical protein